MRTISIVTVLILFPTAAMSGNFSQSFQKDWEKNTASMFQGGGNLAATVQAGERNKATTTQTGHYNLSSIGQVGHGHTKSHVQTGTGKGHGSMQFSTMGATHSSSATAGNSTVSVTLDFEAR